MKTRDYTVFLLHAVSGLVLQVLLSEGPTWHVYFASYPYVLPFLLAPMLAPMGRQLVAAFCIGLMVDFLYGTSGIHSAATIAMTYARGFILTTFTPVSLQESQVYPRPFYMGWGWYLIYLSSLVLLHQFCVFSLESGFVYTVYSFFMFMKSMGVTLLFFILLEVRHHLMGKKR